MKEITIISGKGGSGKTSLTGALRLLASPLVSVDADVDAPNLSLIAGAATRLEEHEFIASSVATVDSEKCNGCNHCGQLCRYGAISAGRVDPLRCEGCGLCQLACPNQAVTMEEVESGRWFVSETQSGPLVHACLHPGAENSGKLVTAVRRRARELATAQGLALILADGPPGIGCPVMAALTGSNLALLVTEPSPSGLHDLERVWRVCQHFRIQAQVVVNKSDLSPENTERIEAFAKEEGMALAGRIPFDRAVTAAVSAGAPLNPRQTGKTARAIRQIWEKISQDI